MIIIKGMDLNRAITRTVERNRREYDKQVWIDDDFEKLKLTFLVIENALSKWQDAHYPPPTDATDDPLNFPRLGLSIFSAKSGEVAGVTGITPADICVPVDFQEILRIPRFQMYDHMRRGMYKNRRRFTLLEVPKGGSIQVMFAPLSVPEQVAVQDFDLFTTDSEVV